MDPDKIKGDIRRPPPQEPEQSDKIDPEKFKRVMKIDESDETQKRNKRNLRKEEEEGEDEEVDETAPPPAANTFSEYMSDKDELDSVFDKESGGIQRKAAPKEDSIYSPPSKPIDTKGVELDEEDFIPPPAKPPTFEGGAPPPLYEGETPEAKKEEPMDQETAPQHDTKEAAQPTEKEKKKEEDASLLASQPKLSELKPKKKKRAKKQVAPREEITPPKQEVEKPGEIRTKETKGHIPTEVEGVKQPEKEPTTTPLKKSEGKEDLLEKKKTPKESVPPPDQGSSPKETGVFRRLTPEEMRKKRLQKEKESSPIEEIALPAMEEKKQGGMGEKDQEKEDQHGFTEANRETASIPLPTFDPPPPPVTPTESTPTYSKLSSEVYDLFEKMGGVLMIKQNEGITTTTMNINLQGSVFHGAEIILEKYSTAPHSYNLQLVGKPEAVKMFTENLTKLDDAFKQANYNFEVNLLSPSLSKGKKSPHLIRRKGSSGGKGGNKGK